MTFKQTKSADELANLLQNELIVKKAANYKKLEVSQEVINKLSEASKLMEDIGYFHISNKLSKIASKIVKQNS